MGLCHLLKKKKQINANVWCILPERGPWPPCVRVVLCLGLRCRLVPASPCSLTWVPDSATRSLQCVWSVCEGFPIYVKIYAISNLMAILAW